MPPDLRGIGAQALHRKTALLQCRLYEILRLCLLVAEGAKGDQLLQKLDLTLKRLVYCIENTGIYGCHGGPGPKLNAGAGQRNR
ncbi:hypothetical protein NN6n1_06420 [Shinella zoogloeoides]